MTRTTKTRAAVYAIIWLMVMLDVWLIATWWSQH